MSKIVTRASSLDACHDAVGVSDKVPLAGAQQNHAVAPRVLEDDGSANLDVGGRHDPASSILRAAAFANSTERSISW